MKTLDLALPAVAAIALTACATLPSGPSVMVLPGRGKSFEQFQVDDATCRSWAAARTGIAPQQAAAGTATAHAAVGTAVGAAAGAALGAAAGAPATGAAVGAGSGLLLGTASGASAGAFAGAQLQDRYDDAYMQCMYAKGNQIPVPMGSMQGPFPAAGAVAPYASPPPPPPGAPPPPPPDAG